MGYADAGLGPRSVLRCPVCRQPLHLAGRSYRCNDSHTFDVAREGYVNLLLSHQKRSRQPGYDPEMMASRRRFLSRGRYEQLVRLLTQLMPADRGTLAILDAGCGEGHYLTAIAAAHRRTGTEVEAWGVDLSKHGVRMAAARDKSCGWAVGNLFDLPFLDRRFDRALSVFSPLAWDELERVVVADGRVVVVGPGPLHLSGLKAVLYKQPEEFLVRDHLDDEAPFCLESRHRVQFEMAVDGGDGVRDLLQMTPYYWSVPPEARERALELPSLRTPVDFDVAVYAKRP